MKLCCDRCDRPLRHYSEPWVQYLNRIPTEWRELTQRSGCNAFDHARGHQINGRWVCGRCHESQRIEAARNQKRALLRRKASQLRRKK